MVFKKQLLGIAILSFIGGMSFAKAPVPVSRFDLTTSVFCGQTKGLMDVIENDINEECFQTLWNELGFTFFLFYPAYCRY